MIFTCKNCGLEIPDIKPDDFPITCACGARYDAPEGPTIFKKVANFAKAAASHIAAGRPETPPAVYKERLAICQGCEHNVGGRCLKCGCGVTGEGVLNKLSWADQSCPVGKWGRADKRAARMLPTEEMVKDVYALARQLPPDITRILGVSRSGLFPASLLAMHLHAELGAIDGNNVIDVGHGWRRRETQTRPGRTLVVDDSTATGRSAKRAAGLGDLFAVVYANPKAPITPDYHARALELPHYFQWNLFNSHYKAAYDFDGVLCEDVTARDELNGDYLKVIKERPPLYLPRRRPIELIVTARLDKYREATLQWLKRHNVRVKRLIMWEGEGSGRNKRKAISSFKAKAYLETNLELFIESDPTQAREIAEISKRPVVCTQTNEVF